MRGAALLPLVLALAQGGTLVAAQFPDLDPTGMFPNSGVPPVEGGIDPAMNMQALPPMPALPGIGVEALPDATATPAQDYEDYIFKAHEAAKNNYDKFYDKYYQNEVQSENYNAWANTVRANNRKAYKTYTRLYNQIYKGDYDVPTNTGFLQQKEG